MTLSLSLNTTAAAGAVSPATKAGFTQPAVGDLVFFNAAVAVGTSNTFGAISDNSSGGAAWIPFPNGPIFEASTFRGQIWYKVANAQDHANLTSVSVVINGAITTEWVASVASFTGFVGTATADMVSNNPTGSGVTTLTATAAGSQAAPAEVTFGALSLSGGSGGYTGVSTFYSPDGGTTHFAQTQTAALVSGWEMLYALPTSGGSSAEWIWTWTNSRSVVAMAMSFYDKPAATNQGNMFAVMGP